MKAAGGAPARGTRTACQAAVEGKEAKTLEAQCHSDSTAVDAAGRWSDSAGSYPGRAARLPVRRSWHSSPQGPMRGCSPTRLGAPTSIAA